MKEKWSVILLGDWVIDEYCLVTTFSSGLSSHTVPQHFRITKATVQGAVYPSREIAGAGHVSRVLNKSNKSFRVFAFGEWNHDDTLAIQDLLEERPGLTRPEFRLSLSSGEAKPIRTKIKSLSPQSSTTRIIRYYEKADEMAAGVRLHSRIDWEDAPQERNDGPIPLTIDQEWALPGDLDPKRLAIVIYDLDKGSVSEARIRYLSKRFPSARWYVFTKSSALFWQEMAQEHWWAVIKDKVRMLFLGPESLIQYNALNNWLVDHQVSRECFNLLRELEAPALTVLATEDHNIIARIKKEEIYVSRRRLATDRPREKVGWSSTLFGYIVEELFDGRSIGPAHIERSLLKLGGDERYFQVIPWPTQELRWKLFESPQTEEFSDVQKMGIVQEGGEHRLELWRSYSDLPNFMTCVSEKRAELINISESLRAFQRSARSRNIGILLEADPGSGKTFLARTLATWFNFEFVTCNIAQMIRPEDILDFFDDIANRQARNERELLIFVDEINAPLGGTTVYGSFLTPLEEGVYARGRQRFRLRPCVWIFAGTPDKEGPKWEDLSSRIAVQVNLSYNSFVEKLENNEAEKERIERQARLEQVYFGASMIKNHYSDVQAVSGSVLWRFYALPPESRPFREISRAVALLRDLKHGVVTRDNWGMDWGKPLHAKELVREIEEMPERVRLMFRPEFRVANL